MAANEQVKDFADRGLSEFNDNADQLDQYLTFIVEKEEYGVDILSVQEIRGWDSATSIPNAPAYLKGVINLRGTIVPIVDLRTRFNLPTIEYGPMTVVIVLKLRFKDKERVVGVVVDAVSDVYSIPKEDIKESPEMDANISSNFIKGLANVNEKMIILLDLALLMEPAELAKIGV
ncbi:chemotaxis protein CheW [Gynuella sunshinyii]|uniref:Chemotaxis protein CheW n=1 Tax=Gynuella sunshinyii YC6258 TaxID=1445510 RepID=A0A0C5W0X1_9GAMM|nr:chemotaxis protein CheW [Gynuella sunshinyii]AJQ96329.1 chemotaxis signal transduction protein [Gynuella sunshinyii YC6258]